MSTTCIFCKIATHQIPAKILYEDDRAVAFADTNPQAPVHVLVIPRRHIASLNEPVEDPALLGHLLLVAAGLAKEKQIDASGYRTVINTNADAGQSVFHLHVHLLGARSLAWPPG
jgi:histidine triad (HIT) family protein